jgi:hypothetical protein
MIPHKARHRRKHQGEIENGDAGTNEDGPPAQAPAVAAR